MAGLVNPNTSGTYVLTYTTTNFIRAMNSTTATVIVIGIGPFPATQPPSLVGSGSATLNGTVNPNHLATVAWFDWGQGLNYGISTTPVNVGSSGSPVSLSSMLAGLQPGRSYHYRMVATNLSARTVSWDQRFPLPLVTVTGGNPYTNLLGAPLQPVSINATPLAVAAGARLSLALKADGTVTAWGDSVFGQTAVPADLHTAVAIAAGVDSFFALALKADGTVVGWGFDIDGVTDIPGTATNIVAIAAGGVQCLGLRSDGTVVVWGDNEFGQVDGAKNLTNIVAVASGVDYCLALRADGTVLGWGNNEYHTVNIPLGLTNVVAISAGPYCGLALKGDGTVVGWGSSPYPVLAGIGNITNAVAISAGDAHNVALLRDGTVACFGENDDNDTVPPPGLTNVVVISAGSGFTLALTADGNVVGWGFAIYGDLDMPPGLTSLSDPVTINGSINPNQPGTYPFTASTTNYLGAVNSVSGVVVVTVPVLQVKPDALGMLNVSWSPDLPGYQLQESSNLLPGSWNYTASGATNPVTMPASAGNDFFRLAHP